MGIMEKQALRERKCRRAVIAEKVDGGISESGRERASKSF